MQRRSGAAHLGSLVVLAVTVGFYSYAVNRKQQSGAALYPLRAVFLSSNGLQRGADVRLAGVRIGKVSSIALDPEGFVARVGFSVEDRYRLPADTSLSIGSSGFTAANDLLVEPGRSQQMLVAGDTIRNTREMLSLEQSVSQYIFGAGGLGDSRNP